MYRCSKVLFSVLALIAYLFYRIVNLCEELQIH